MIRIRHYKNTYDELFPELNVKSLHFDDIMQALVPKFYPMPKVADISKVDIFRFFERDFKREISFTGDPSQEFVEEFVPPFTFESFFEIAGLAVSSKPMARYNVRPSRQRSLDWNTSKRKRCEDEDDDENFSSRHKRSSRQSSVATDPRSIDEVDDGSSMADGIIQVLYISNYEK